MAAVTRKHRDKDRNRGSDHTGTTRMAHKRKRKEEPRGLPLSDEQEALVNDGVQMRKNLKRRTMERHKTTTEPGVQKATGVDIEESWQKKENKRGSGKGKKERRMRFI